MKYFLKTNVMTKTVLKIALTSMFLLSCSSIKYVDFDDSSDECRSTREIVHIESKMIPSDEVLNARYKTPECIGELEGDGSVADAAAVDEDEDSKLLEEGENFVTRPDGKFFRASVEEGKYVVYWIHYVSPDPAVLEFLSTDDETVYETVNKVIAQMYLEGQFKTTQWENELNDRILNALSLKPELKNLTKVVIHLGC